MSRERLLATIAAAKNVEPESPRPLMRELPPADPFPIDALGGVLAPAARAIHDRVQAPGHLRSIRTRRCNTYGARARRCRASNRTETPAYEFLPHDRRNG
jgi:hypothetical protein